MYTIKNNIISTYEIKKSKFITFLYRINSIDEVNLYLNKTKNEYKDATHYCLAYKLGPIQKFDDDNEPSHTAGLPMLEVLNQKEVDYILCIVVRYFGGIKLGASGLTRTYRKVVADSLKEVELVPLVKGYLIELRVPYSEQKNIDYLFQNEIIDKKYDEEVLYIIELPQDRINELDKYPYNIKEEKMIEKELPR